MKIIKYALFILLLVYSIVVSYFYFYKKEAESSTKSVEKEDRVSVNIQNSSKKEIEKSSNQKKSSNNSQNIENKSKEIPKDAIVVKVPKPPKVKAKVPVVVTVGGGEIRHKEHQRLSTAMPEVKKESKKSVDENKTKKVLSTVGLNKHGRVSTYLRGKLISKDDVKKRLKSAGFKIVAINQLDQNGDLEVILFTDEKLKKLANNSPYLANIRLLIDKKNSQISIANPFYFAKAFLRDKFDKDSAKEILERITSSFDGLKDSSDKLKYTLISKYQFMFGMPYYDDFIVVAKGKQERLLQKIESKKSSISFRQNIGTKRVLVGIKLSNKTRGFINDIGVQNSLLLPYPIVIENGEAKILNPKYYIAISYPMLKMSQFMKISKIPDEIEAECRRLFQ